VVEIVVYGTAAADIVVQVPRFPEPGDHLSATSLGWRLGGGSANVAVALAAAGHRVELIGPFGRDPMGDALIGELERRGVRTGRSLRVDAPTARALILLQPGGERTILGLDSALASDVYPMETPPDPGNAEVVYVETYARFPTSLADQARNALVVVPFPPSSHGAWPADILVGSERNFPAEWRTEPFHGGRAAAGPRLRWVVMTRGVLGAVAYGQDEVIETAARPATQVDATGAGDAFAAGLIEAVLTGVSMQEAMSYAAERGAGAVEWLQSIPPAATEAIGRTWPRSG
jgi:sugar/nucleoside kinase (ribokinase family)